LEITNKSNQILLQRGRQKEYYTSHFRQRDFSKIRKMNLFFFVVVVAKVKWCKLSLTKSKTFTGFLLKIFCYINNSIHKTIYIIYVDIFVFFYTIYLQYIPSMFCDIFFNGYRGQQGRRWATLSNIWKKNFNVGKVSSFNCWFYNKKII